MAGQWSVRELRRQIGSLLFERTALSIDKAKLAQLAKKGHRPEAVLTIRDPYIFEFLGMKPTEVMGESQLEDALLNLVSSLLTNCRGSKRQALQVPLQTTTA